MIKEEFPQNKRELLSRYSTRSPIKVAEYMTARISGKPIFRDATLGSGETMQVVLPDTPSTFLYLAGDYEPEVSQALREILRPGMTVYNIGAHIGTRVVQSSGLIGDQGNIVAFEPTQRTRRVLERNSHNRKSPVEIFGIGLGDTDGEADLHDLGWSCCGSNTLGDNVQKFNTRLGRKPENRLERVPLRRLDDVAEGSQLKPPHVIVMDVEGYEGRVIDGAKNVLSDFKPAVIFEVGNQSDNDPFGAVYRLADIGYKFFGKLGDSPIDPENIGNVLHWDGLTNILAIHPSNSMGSAK